MENPVVVHPDMASKMLSVTLIWRPIMKGRAPTRAITNQVSATAAIATLNFGTWSVFGTRAIRAPSKEKQRGAESIAKIRSHS
jgi:mRNA-degrading endonuclease toxin of MazEF toxin-antitoxin module